MKKIMFLLLFVFILFITADWAYALDDDLMANPVKWYEKEELFLEDKGITRVAILENGNLVWGKMVYNTEDKKITMDTGFGKLKFFKSQTLYVFNGDESKKIIELNTALATLTKTQKILKQYMIRKRIGKLDFYKPYLFLLMTEGMIDEVPVCTESGKIEIQNRYEPLMKCTYHGSRKHIIHQLRDFYGKAFYRIMEL